MTGLVFILVGLAIALALHALAVEVIRRGLRRRSEFTRALLVQTRGPTRLALVVVALSWIVRVAPLSPRQDRWMQHGLLVAFVILVGWMVLAAVSIASNVYMRRYRVDVSDNVLARKHLTQIRILRRAVSILVIVLTVGMALMTIPAVRQLGVSLLAAGGAAGIIVGLALQPLLSNLIAGVQLALTQPIRLDDNIKVGGESGRVEEINATYVVLRLWDHRRMVLPLKYFLDQPFENWTRTSAELIGPVYLHLDYRAPLAPLRAKYLEILEAAPLWDGKASGFHVTEARERSLQVRFLVSASDAGKLFDLSAYLREALVTWLQAELPQALPDDASPPPAPEPVPPADRPPQMA